MAARDYHERQIAAAEARKDSVDRHKDSVMKALAHDASAVRGRRQ